MLDRIHGGSRDDVLKCPVPEYFDEKFIFSESGSYGLLHLDITPAASFHCRGLPVSSQIRGSASCTAVGVI